MDRIIKFRAWDKGQMKMRDVHTLYLDVQIGMGPSDRAILVDLYEASKTYHVDRDVNLMQFTGLLDKNDKEIYEGDIVRVNGGEPKFEFVSQVIFARGAFRIAAVYDQGFPHKDDIEAIGNIYETPELLDEQARTA